MTSRAPSGNNFFQPLSTTEIERSEDPTIKAFGIWVLKSLISSLREVLAHRDVPSAVHDYMSLSGTSSSDMNLDNWHSHDIVEHAINDDSEVIFSDLVAPSGPNMRNGSFLLRDVQFQPVNVPAPTQTLLPRKRGRPVGSRLVNGKLNSTFKRSTWSPHFN